MNTEKQNKAAIELALQAVCDKFELVDIKLVNCHMHVTEQEVLDINTEPKAYKSFTLSRKDKLLFEYDEKNTSQIKSYTFAHKFGVRLATTEEAIDSPDYEVEAYYMAKYVLKPGNEPITEPSQLDLFAEINVPHNLWAFWRELVHSLLTRAGLGSVVLPLRHIRPPEVTKGNDSE